MKRDDSGLGDDVMLDVATAAKPFFNDGRECVDLLLQGGFFLDHGDGRGGLPLHGGLFCEHAQRLGPTEP